MSTTKNYNNAAPQEKMLQDATIKVKETQKLQRETKAKHRQELKQRIGALEEEYITTLNDRKKMEQEMSELKKLLEEKAAAEEAERRARLDEDA